MIDFINLRVKNHYLWKRGTPEPLLRRVHEVLKVCGNAIPNGLLATCLFAVEEAPRQAKVSFVILTIGNSSRPQPPRWIAGLFLFVKQNSKTT